MNMILLGKCKVRESLIYFRPTSLVTFHPKRQIRLKMFQNRVLKKISGLLQSKQQENGDQAYITISFIICTFHQMLL
jgi:hypothetical protein